LLPDPVVADFNALDLAERQAFAADMSIVGDVLLEITGAVRINYEMIGNVEPALHGHIFPRFADEPEDLRLKPVWFYDWDSAPSFDAARDGPLMAEIAAKLEKLGVLRDTP